MMGDPLALHRELVGTPSVSGNEGPLAQRVSELLAAPGVTVHRFGDNVIAVAGDGPTLLYNTHLDTVPAASGWTRDPHVATEENGRIYGLGSNDAKASVAAMMSAFGDLTRPSTSLPIRLVLTLVAGEEVGGRGTEALLPELARLGLRPDAVVVGEPTGLDIAVAQKGLLILELIARGDACHAAHGARLGARNALRVLARDIVALERFDAGPPHPLLGPVTLEPTMASGGTARNVVPGEARCYLDIRSNPEPDHAALTATVESLVESEVRVHSDRLRPCEFAQDSAVVHAARAARPDAQVFGSRGLSDLLYFAETPAIKVGPGETERSHTPDEYVRADEILDGVAFYTALAREFAAHSAPAQGG